MNLENVVAQLKSERDRLDKAITALAGLDGTGNTSAPRRKMSAAGRARIVAAQKARWRKIKAAKKR